MTSMYTILENAKLLRNGTKHHEYKIDFTK
jgi:hypothetical protein